MCSKQLFTFFSRPLAAPDLKMMYKIYRLEWKFVNSLNIHIQSLIAALAVGDEN